jgi:light-regulated signal transduction histidine kinase (bacteriophytochrome)
MSDPLDDIEKTAELLPAAAAGVRLGDRANRQLERFSDAARQERRLKAMAEFAVLFDGRSDAQVKAQMTRALANATEAAEAMQDVVDEDTLQDAVEAYQAFTQAQGVLENVVRPLWTRVVDQQFAPLASVGALLEEAFPNARELGRKMTEAAAQAQRHALSPIADLLPIAKALLEDRSALVAEQQTVAGDPKVAAFLQALAADRATLDLLETEVLDWLKGQGALTSLKVTAA